MKTDNWGERATINSALYPWRYSIPQLLAGELNIDVLTKGAMP